MKKIYWRPRAVSRPALLLITIISLAGLSLVERWKVENQQPFYEEKMAAARLAQEGFAAIKAARLELGSNRRIDRSIDPAGTGLIGLPMSAVTSVSGEVAAKQTAANPNFAAVMVELLKEAGVREGDCVAIGLSGSFPALNICTYAACETLKLRPLVISSASASQFGANIPELMWPQMERILRRQGRRVPVLDEATGEPKVDPEGNPVTREVGVFKTKSIAVSIGGVDDRGTGLTEEGLNLVRTAIETTGLTPFRPDAPPIPEGGDVLEALQKDFAANVDERMALYREHAEGPIKTYINVGGGTVSVGKNIGKLMFEVGLNKRPPRHVRDVDGVMPRFIKEGVPVIHIVHVNTLADRFGLPLEPETMPPVGAGGVFYGIDYSKPLVFGVLSFILLSLYSFIRSDVGFRLLRASQRSRKSDSQPEPMV
jgi:hypothetical protein